MKQANEGKIYLTGATSGLGTHWKAINWKRVENEVKRLQMRIAKAAREEKWNRVKSLQWILTHSFSAKLLAVKRVTSNRGARTPGVDGEVWNTPAKKMRGALSLKRKGYQALPLRRIEIPKSNGKKRLDFLGQHLRKFGNKLIITPSKKNTKDFLDKVRQKIKQAHGWSCADLIKTLNPIIRGWCYYHRCVQSFQTFSYATKVIIDALLAWAKRKHRRSQKWIKRKYFDKSRTAWVFACFIKVKDGGIQLLELIKPTLVKVVRYYKIKGAANPFDPKYSDYFAIRRRLSNVRPITI